MTHADDYKEWVASRGKRPRLIRVTSMHDMLSFSFPNEEAHLRFSPHTRKCDLVW